MVKVFVSSVMDAPIGKVWPFIRDFGGIGKFGPIVARCEIEAGEPGDRVGCIRAIHTHDGGLLRESLVELSDVDHVLKYSMVESPLGVTDYLGVMRATPVTDGDRTFVEWFVSFNCAPGRETALLEMIRDGVFAPGLEKMKTLL